jgi:hypothetical protein
MTTRPIKLGLALLGQGSVAEMVEQARPACPLICSSPATVVWWPSNTAHTPMTNGRSTNYWNSSRPTRDSRSTKVWPL